MKFLPSVIFLGLIAPSLVAQGHGNGRDILLTTSVNAGAADGSSKLVAPGAVLVTSLTSPLGTLVGQPLVIAVDFIPRTADPSMSLPNEPDVIGVSETFIFAVEGTGTLPALLPGTAVLTAGGWSVPVFVPGPPIIPAGLSIYLQAFMPDPGAVNGVAASAVVRHDYEIFSGQSTFADPGLGSDANAGYAIRAADVNGDGFEDLLIGERGADPGGVTDAGQVTIRFGPDQLTSLVLASPLPVAGARFGGAIAVADLDGDGAADILVGAREEVVGGLTAAGAVWVFMGPSFGNVLQILSPELQAGAFFGHSVDAGDVTGDGYPDIVVGSHLQASGGLAESGAVHVFHGRDFLTTTTLVDPAPQVNARFGYRVLVADLTGDSVCEVAVSSPWYDIVTPGDNSGAVRVFEGGTLAPLGYIPSPRPSVAVSALFGDELASGDLDGDGIGDLAVGGEFVSPLGGLDGQGIVLVAKGPLLTGGTTVVSPSPSLTGGFGSGLAVGDANRDGVDDLFVGEFYADPGGVTDAGVVHLLLGPSFGQSRTITAPAPAQGSNYGRRVARADTDGDGFAEILVGVPFDSPSGVHYAGAAYLVR